MSLTLSSLNVPYYNNFQMYNALADIINVNDISANSNNRDVLRRLQRNNADDKISELFIRDEPLENEEEDGEDCVVYCP